MHTIRGKIRLAYLTFALIIGAISLLAFLDLHYLDRRIEQGAVIAQLKENGLEMRRHEKNYFLYFHESSRQEALRLAYETRGILADEEAALEGVMNAAERSHLAASLQSYAEQLALLKLTDGSTSDSRALRDAGHAISEQLTGMAQREREILRASVMQSQRTLLFSIAAVLLLAATIGWLLTRAVVEPLRQLERQLQPIADGKFHALTITTRDQELISFAQAINRMLAELEARRRQLLHSEKLASLGVLVSGVAHELNNPLSNISTSAQLLLEELESAERAQKREWLVQIEEQIERARAIVRSLLEFSRDTPFEVRPVAIGQVVAQSVSFLRNEIKGQLDVRSEIDPQHVVAGDVRRLQQVFINLLRNAADAVEAETQVRIAAHRLAKGEQVIPQHAYLFGNGQCTQSGKQDMVVITVEDDGPGIDAETLPKIFDPFFTTKGVGHGMGLGLYVVMEIIEEHKGCIAVESEPGRGTRFTIVLPAMEAGESK